MNDLLSVRDLTVAYGSRLALAATSFRCAGGEILGIVGPNGAGKSSLLKAVLGLVPAQGEILFGRVPIAGCRHRVAYIPQRSSVDWDYPATVREIVAMGRTPRLGLWRRMSRRDHALVDDALDRVRLSDLRDRPIGDLSGGQQQRMFLARALAQEAEMLLLDEPFQGVDTATETILWKELRRLAGDGRAVLVVHHDLSAVERNFDSVLVLNGKVVAFGPVQTAFDEKILQSAYMEPVLSVVAAR